MKSKNSIKLVKFKQKKSRPISGKISPSLKGFTLIEILMALTVFLLIIGTISGLFISMVKSQRKILEYQEFLDQTSYIMEYMTRSLRMAGKEFEDGTSGLNCLDNRGDNYDIISNGIRFINQLETGPTSDYICQEIFLEGTQIMQKKRTISPVDTIELPLTSPKLIVQDLKFVASGETQYDEIQPRVTILLDVQFGNDGPKNRIQTTISQRNLDIEE